MSARIIFIISSLNAILIGAAILAKFIADNFSDETFDSPALNKFWGPAENQYELEDKAFASIKITIGDQLLEGLNAKLEQELYGGRFQESLEGVGFQYGLNSKILAEQLLPHWMFKYNWKERQEQLNIYPQYKTRISGIEVHFQYINNDNNAKFRMTRPLLLIHGFPGTIVEFQKLIVPLFNPNDTDVNFALVIPSLPGSGFSDKVSQPGLGTLEVAQMLHKLMQRLDFTRYFVHGGDVGSIIANQMAIMYPESIIGVHSTSCLSLHSRTFARMAVSAVAPALVLSAEERKGFSRFLKAAVQETGYLHMQITKPDTIGYGLAHSPGGLASYLLEKYFSWTNPEGLNYLGDWPLVGFTIEDLLDIVMIYWTTNTFTTATRLQADSLTYKSIFRVPVKTPTACLLGQNDPFIGQTRAMLQDTYHNIVSYQVLENVGHFVTFQDPLAVAKDLIEFARLLENPEDKMPPQPASPVADTPLGIEETGGMTMEKPLKEEL